MKNSTINGEEITDELRRKIASRLRGKAKIATPDTVDSLLMEAVYRDRRKAPGFIYGDIRR